MSTSEVVDQEIEAPARRNLAQPGFLVDVPAFELSPSAPGRVARKSALRRRVALGRLTPGEKLSTEQLETRFSREFRRMIGGEERHYIVKANPLVGFPGDVGQKLLYALTELWTQQARPEDPCVYVTRAELCRKLRMEVSGANYDVLLDELKALRTLLITYTNAFPERAPDPTTGRKFRMKPGNHSVSYIDDWSFPAETVRGTRAEQKRSVFLEAVGAADRSKVPLPKGIPWIKLGVGLHQTLKERFLIPVNLDYFLALEKPIQRRLYAYLNARMGAGKFEYEENIRQLRDLLPLHESKPGRLMTLLARHLDALMKPRVIEGKTRWRFLEHHEFRNEKTGWDATLYVRFHGRSPLADVRRRLAGGRSRSGEPEQEELFSLE